MTSDAQRIQARGAIAGALALGTIALLMIGVQPIVLGELVAAKQVSLEGVGLVAMGEIVALGLGVLLGDGCMPLTRPRRVALGAALCAGACNLVSMRASGDLALLAVRAAAGLAEGVLLWSCIAVIVRTRSPDRVAGIFVVVQTAAQALLGVLLAQLVIPQLGWPGAFAALALLSVLACSVIAWQPARLNPLSAPLSASADAGLRWSARTALPLAVAFLLFAAIGAFWAYLEPLGQAAGFDGPAAQTLVAAVLAAQIVGGCIASACVRRWPAMPVLIAGAAALIGVAAVVLGARGAAPFASVCLLFGAVWLFMMPFQIRLAFHADPSGHVATLVPAWQLFGSAFGPLAASFTVSGDDASVVPAVSILCAAAAMLSLLLLGRRRAGG